MQIGIDLGGTKIEIVALSTSGNEIYRKRIHTPREYDATLSAIKELVHEAESVLGQTGTVGMGIPGTLSPVTGVVKNANSVWLNGKPLDKDLSNLLEREIRIANDANCMAVSEAKDGAGEGHSVVLAFILGTGAGSGIVINGNILCGGNGISGEWGHNQLPWIDDADRLSLSQMQNCYCQRIGCIEQFVSGTGLCDEYWRRTQTRKNGADIVQLAEQGDRQAQQTLDAYEKRLAKAIAAYSNILDPDVIVLAGGVSNIQRLYKNLPALIQPHIFGGEFNTQIKQAQHGDSSGVRGAAWLWNN